MNKIRFYQIRDPDGHLLERGKVEEMSISWEYECGYDRMAVLRYPGPYLRTSRVQVIPLSPLSHTLEEDPVPNGGEASMFVSRRGDRKGQFLGNAWWGSKEQVSRTHTRKVYHVLKWGMMK